MSAFVAGRHPRKGAGSDTGNAGHFAAVAYAETGVGVDADLDLDFLDVW